MMHTPAKNSTLSIISLENTHMLQIQNVIATADLGHPVDATRFNQYSWGRYDLENNYNGKVGYVKDRKIQGRVTVFLSGKMISTGAKSVNQSIRNLKHTRYLLSSSAFIQSERLKPKVRNIVATMDFRARLDMYQLTQKLSKILYEPGLFPAAIYKTEEGPTCLIFASGKLVISGAKSEIHLKEVANALRTRLSQFKQSESI
jgi:transcription initiation factor TFIID TATA-box-binding protein